MPDRVIALRDEVELVDECARRIHRRLGGEQVRNMAGGGNGSGCQSHVPVEQ